MKLTKKIALLSICLITVFTACKKVTPVTPAGSIPDGTYTGALKLTRANQTSNFPLTLVLDKHRYSGFSRTGSFTQTAKTITFTDDNMATADFNYFFILEGTYNYTFDGKNLSMNVDKNTDHHQIDLVKDSK